MLSLIIGISIGYMFRKPMGIIVRKLNQKMIEYLTMNDLTNKTGEAETSRKDDVQDTEKQQRRTTNEGFENNPFYPNHCKSNTSIMDSDRSW